MPDFCLPAITGEQRGEISSRALSGSAYILYFYPRASTPGCTEQACLVRDSLPSLLAEFPSVPGLRVLGVSPDSLSKLVDFIRKERLDFTLVSDEFHQLAEACGVWKEKKLYGRSYMGIERTTMLVDEHGILRSIKRNIKPREQAIWMKQALEALAVPPRPVASDA